MRRGVLRFVAFAAVGLFGLYAGIEGARRAASRVPGSGTDARGARAPRFFTARGAFGHPDPTRAGIDPYAPPGLPPGVTIDPSTGRMQGLLQDAPAGVAWITWQALGASTYERGLADVPNSLRALEGKPVALAGFLKAIYEFEHIRTFLLVGSHLACCFGTFPGAGGVVEVSIEEDQPDAERGVMPILVVGRLSFEPLYDSFDGRRRIALLFHLRGARIRKLSE